MFQYQYPQFEPKRLLRIDMLEQLRDYPRSYLNLWYRDFGDGIISGCKITWDNAVLTISPGMIYRSGHLYFMETPYSLACPAQEQQSFVKVQFLAEGNESGGIAGNSRILMDQNSPDPSCEMELCRFLLQEGARLRWQYENFEDYATEYDTVNIIHAPFAAKGGNVLNPEILMRFSEELLRGRTIEPYDVSFAMNVLANNGIVSAECVRVYIEHYFGSEQKERSLMECYRSLLKMLKKETPGNYHRDGNNREQKRIMLF